MIIISIFNLFSSYYYSRIIIIIYYFYYQSGLGINDSTVSLLFGTFVYLCVLPFYPSFFLKKSMCDNSVGILREKNYTRENKYFLSTRTTILEL